MPTKILLALSLLGLLDTIYLLFKSKPGSHLPCPTGSECSLVTQSKWNKFLGIKNEIWGIVYYLSLLILLFIYPPLLHLAIFFGFVYSLYLTYIQIFKIKQYCLFCLLSAGVNLLLLITILI